ncbi:MAG: diacylglycerol O-acyltransferase [Bermanella sp.]|jgi:diacylglycerol O-acyltransferase
MAVINTQSSGMLSALLTLESADTPMHLGCLLRFRLPKKASADFLAELAAGFRAQTELIAPWHWRLKHAGLRALRPQWQECSSVDMEYHFRQIGLPAPGGERELGVLVSRLHSQVLDMSRPPWECYLIEGLDEGNFALYLKVHRALVDVAGGPEIFHAFLARSAAEQSMPAPWTTSIDSDDLRKAPSFPLAETLRAPTGLGSAFGRLLSAGVRKNQALAVPYSAPRSALNGPVNNQRRFATQQYQRSRLQALSKALGHDDDTVILLYLCGSALRRFLKEFNALPDEPLIAAVPQSKGSLSDFSLSFVSLASDQVHALERFATVQRSYAAAQEHLGAVPKSLRTAYSLAAGAPFLLGQLSGTRPWMPAMFNVFVNIMPAPEEQRYLGGAVLESIHSLSMLMPGAALSVSCQRYAGTVNIGLTGARDTLPHLQRLAVYMEQALEQLESEVSRKENAV